MLHSIVRLLLPLFLLGAASTSAAASPPARAPDLRLEGVVTGADHEKYRRIPFELPRGVERLVVAFEQDGKEQRTVIDLGIEDPNGLRGASGGNKAVFTLSASDATPSYLPGPLDAGRWHLMLGIPNARANSTARWQARLWFLRGAEAQIAPAGAIKSRGPAWYRGDMHLHSAHSDGSCDSKGGARARCPLFRTLEAAAARGLDFVMLTEHNTTSHHAPIVEMQPYFDTMLLIPGREITTFYGHFNIFGVTAPIDYRVQPGGPVSFNTIADKVHALGGLVAINHPSLPSGEACMGCGWTMPDADMDRVDLIEAINGSSIAGSDGNPDGPYSGVAFWHRHGAAAGKPPIGGSDNHDPGREGGLGTIGHPATVVFAEGLTVAAILAGLRKGRSFVDLTGSRDAMLDLSLCSAGSCSAMGEKRTLKSGDVHRLRMMASIPGATRLRIVDAIGNRDLSTQGLGETETVLTLPKGKSAIYAVAEDAAGRMLAISNSIRLTVE
jgi:hypothetical protein